MEFAGNFGLEGFEPSASWSRTKRATKLRYSPLWVIYLKEYFNGSGASCQITCLFTGKPEKKPVMASCL
jgi:hypothetical protein